MTSRFQTLPIRRKLLLMSLASSITAVVLASGGFLAWEVYQFRTEVEREITTQAKLVADSAAPAMNFRDPAAARDTLAGLARSPYVRLACLYADYTAGPFSTYEPVGERCPQKPADTAGFSWSRFEWHEPVRDEDSRVGSLYIVRDLDDMHRRLRVGAGTVLGLLLLSIGAAFLLSARLERAIAAPLLNLAETARAVSRGQGDSPRAVPPSSDELGVVVHAFNDMLDRIEARSRELSQANADLQREIAERRRIEAERGAALERERDANRLKDEFLATLSHELRTPLNAVLGWARVLRTSTVDDTVRDRAMESIERNARTQARLIEDLLEVSRIVTGKLRLRVDRVDLAAIVDAAVEVVQPAAAAKRLQLDLDVQVRPAMTAGDGDRLQQIVWNLLSNAVKFTPSGGRVAVSLSLRDVYVIAVTDTGPGIAPKFLPYVFEPFRQADGSASREHGGLGLGLAIAKRLVELHGGTIEARHASDEGGSIFEVRLPSVLAESADEPVDTDEPPMAAGTPQPHLLEHVRVLVVDDEEDARALLRTALAAYGADVSIAASADEALHEIEVRPPDVLLSDIGMPNQDGYAFIRKLRERPASAGGSIPAIAITAYASARDRREAGASGYQAHIAKPFEPSEVARMVARLTAQRGRLEPDVP